LLPSLEVLGFATESGSDLLEQLIGEWPFAVLQHADIAAGNANSARKFCLSHSQHRSPHDDSVPDVIAHIRTLLVTFSNLILGSSIRKFKPF
jgi:hypothetical protein